MPAYRPQSHHRRSWTLIRLRRPATVALVALGAWLGGGMHLVHPFLPGHDACRHGQHGCGQAEPAHHPGHCAAQHAEYCAHHGSDHVETHGSDHDARHEVPRLSRHHAACPVCAFLTWAGKYTQPSFAALELASGALFFEPLSYTKPTGPAIRCGWPRAPPIRA